MIFRKYILDKLGFIEYDSRTFSVISLIILAALIVDYFISSSIDAFNPQASSSWGVLLFSTIAIICILGQYLILFITKKRMSKYNVKDSQIITLQKVMTIVLYVMTAVVAVVLLQIYIFSWYYIHLISLVVVIAYGFTSIIMGILSYKLLDWYLSKRSLIILIYGLAAASFTINAVVSAILFEQLLVEKPLIFTTHSVVEFNFECDTNPFKCFITNFQSYTMYAYVLAMWCGSIVLLHYHIKRVGKVKFWVLVTLPLVALYLGYVSAYGELYQMSSTVSKEQTPVIKMSLIIAFTISLGILNGIGFRSVGMLAKSSHIIMEYMICAAYGIVFYFTAANSTVAAAGYPPFGLSSISFVPMSAFLILLGLYYSAISVANDSDLRREIKRSVIKETKLLGSMGEAQMEQELEKKVMKLTNDKTEIMIEQTGIQPSLSIDEAREYLYEVMEEVKDRKK